MKIKKYKASPAISVDQIDLKNLPEQQVTNINLNVIPTAAGDTIQIPIVVARGRHPGPVFGITAAVHGNEVNGVPVIHELMRGIRPNRLHGTIIAAIVVNPPGFEARRRGLVQGIDLNHHFPGKKGSNFINMYAHTVMDKLISKVDYLADLHTASIGRINSLYIRADLQDPEAAMMAYMQRPEIIVHNPPSDYTLRGAAAEMGKPAVTIEIGNPSRFQYKYIRRTLVGIRTILGKLGMIKYDRPSFNFADPIVCEKSNWVYTDSAGILTVFPGLTDMVDKGQQIAQLANIFGQRTRDYFAPQEGVVIGKAVDPVAEVGARVLHLGIPCKPNSRLRRYLDV